MNDSLVSLRQGFPGSMCALLMFASVSHFNTAQDKNSGPLSDRGNLGVTVNAHQFAENFYHASRADAARYIVRQALMRELVDHSQTLQLRHSNKSLRDEYLNIHCFETLADARAKIEAWRID